MDKKLAEAIGLLRHQIISPVLMDSGRSQMKYFRSLETKSFDVPGKGPRKFKATTMKSWLNRYKRFGFAGITPSVRSDAGSYRKISPRQAAGLLELRKEFIELSVVQFYKKCSKEKLLGDPPLCQATIRRFLKLNNLGRPNRIEARKRFEMGQFGEMWTGDYMHGPKVRVGKLKKKAILFAIIDDHSRLIVGSEFALHENTIAVEDVLKNAILSYGVPDKLYLDNGPSFSSKYLARVCAHLKVALVHSKPYDSPSRGKIERFFRTVRGSFFNQLRPEEELKLDELNERFKVWLRDDYHRSYHQGIKARPLDRYNISIMSYPRKMVDPDILNEFFMVSCERVVRKDATISYKGKVYEVPARFISKAIEIRHLQEEDAELFVYEDDSRIARITPVDVIENGRIFKPRSTEHISFTGGEQC